MHFLLSNDDGYDSTGISVLYRAMRQIGSVTVVAPAGERSTAGHSATLDDAMAVTQIAHPIMGDIYAVDGKPVDCVRLAIAELADRPIDAVISGINHGANVSIIDVTSSGTVAAAREGAFNGIRSIAFSQYIRDPDKIDWPLAEKIVRNITQRILKLDAPEPKLWNVNLPAVQSPNRPAGFRVATLSTDPIPLVFERLDSPQPAYQYRGLYGQRTVSDGRDIAALLDDYVTITPLTIDTTHASTQLSRLQRLFDDASPED